MTRPFRQGGHESVKCLARETNLCHTRAWLKFLPINFKYEILSNLEVFTLWELHEAKSFAIATKSSESVGTGVRGERTSCSVAVTSYYS